MNDDECGDGHDCTPEERKAIDALKRLARRWPRTLTLASMGGELVVVKTADDRFLSSDTNERHESVVADIRGIPNTGGDW